MQTSQQGVNLIKISEGCKLEAYQDVDGTWTIGYGDIFITIGGNERRVRQGDSVTQPYAETLFDTGLHEREVLLNDLLAKHNITLNQGQYDSLMDFQYEFGIGKLASSTLFAEICKDINDPDIINQFKRWVHGEHGEVLQGLVTRRQKEIELWTNTINLHI